MERSDLRANTKASWLDEATHFAVDPVAELFHASQKTRDEVAQSAKQLLKTVPLFMAGRAGLVGLAGAYIADEIKSGSSTGEALEDGSLGLLKAVPLALTKRLALGRNTSPSLLGMELGIINRTTNAAFSRDSYTDDQGKFNLSHGLWKTAVTGFHPSALIMDGLTYSASDAAFGCINQAFRFRPLTDPRLRSAIAGGTFGVTSAFGTEVANQVSSGHLDIEALASKTVIAGGMGALGGGIGGLQAWRSARLPVRDSSGPLQPNSAAASEFGRTLDEKLAVLRDGQFKVDSAWKHHIDFYFGKTVGADGKTVPAVFRADDGSKAFADRMQAELAIYGLDSKLNWKDTAVATMPRSIEIDGKRVDGFVQEMRGVSMREYVEQLAGGQPLNRKTVSALLKDNPTFRDGFMTAAARRMMTQQWDNHTHQYRVEKDNPSQVLSIDFDQINPAVTKFDLVPHPGMRNGRDNLASLLYSEVAGKPLPQATRTAMQAFVRSYDSPAGRAELQGLNLSPRQVEGIIGRTHAMAESGVMPRGNELTAFVFVTPVLQQLKYMLRGKSSETPIPNLTGQAVQG